MNWSKVFNFIYKNNLWFSKESVSGVGSTVGHTKEVRREIPKLFDKYNIQSILDIPCGDFNWMKEINLSKKKYIGGDIVEDLVQKNKELYGRENILFKQIDLIKDKLPKVDLIIVRDCFIHLPNKEVIECIKNIKKAVRIIYLPHLIKRLEKIRILYFGGN